MQQRRNIFFVNFHHNFYIVTNQESNENQPNQRQPCVVEWMYGMEWYRNDGETNYTAEEERRWRRTNRQRNQPGKAAEQWHHHHHHIEWIKQASKKGKRVSRVEHSRERRWTMKWVNVLYSFCVIHPLLCSALYAWLCCARLWAMINTKIVHFFLVFHFLFSNVNFVFLNFRF